MKEYLIASNGKQSGPYPEEVIRTMLEQRELQYADLCWTDGMTDWVSLESIFPNPLGMPPQVPTQNLGETAHFAAPDHEEVRKAHIKHEASVKSIGVLYIVGATFLGIGVGASFFNNSENLPQNTVGGIFLLLLLAAQFWTGLRVRKLEKGSRVMVGLLSGLGLLAVPIGTLINAYILYLVFSKKGKVVFSDEYKEAIAATPHIKYKMSIVVWVFLGLLVLVLLFAAAAVLFSKK